MPTELDAELKKCEQALWTMQDQYPAIANAAANARYIYDVAWAEETDRIIHEAVKDGGKPPTVAAIEAAVTLKVRSQMENVRMAEAKLDSAKKHTDTLQAILSSVQTRAKLTIAEMALTR